MHPARTLALALAILTTTACASATAGTRRVMSQRHDLISFQEIAAERASSAFDLVEKLRPFYLRGRDVMSAQPIVYMDDIMLGGVHELRGINARDVLEIRYVRGEEMMFRSQEASGHRVIHVVTRRN
jgi:hypothetical protein